MEPTNENGKTKRSRHNKCCFAGCSRNKRQYPNLHLFQFPVSRPDVCDLWVLNCANDAINSLPLATLKGKVVCDKHFTRDCFTNDMRTKLNKDAVPTILAQEELDNHVPVDVVESSEETPQQMNAPLEVSQTQPTPTVSFSDLSTPPQVMVTEENLGQQMSNETPIARRSIFKTSTPLNDSQSPKSICTPLYKKLKSVQGRKSTPYKVLTPQKKNFYNSCNQQLN